MHNKVFIHFLEKYLKGVVVVFVVFLIWFFVLLIDAAQDVKRQAKLKTQRIESERNMERKPNLTYEDWVVDNLKARWKQQIEDEKRKRKNTFSGSLKAM